MNQKCSGVKSDGSHCPKAGSCSVAKAWNVQVIIEAPFVLEGNSFSCSQYKIMTEENLGAQDFGNYDQINS
jgi:hypothetical protein